MKSEIPLFSEHFALSYQYVTWKCAKSKIH